MARKVSLLFGVRRWPPSITVFVLPFLLSCSGFLVRAAASSEHGRANLEIKTVPVGKFHFTYLEGGTGEIVICIHGFAGEKDHWTRFSAFLTDRYHVIAPDLPGHGDNDRLPDENYSIRSQAQRIHEFAKALGLRKFHMIGSSMGGAIAADYASLYPEDVITLALFDSAGVKSPEKSELTTELEKGNNPLLVSNVDDFNRLMAFTCVKPPYIPGFLKTYFAERAVQNRAFNEKIFADIGGAAGNVEGRLPLIQAKTLILWGDTDRVIHVSSVKIFQAKIKNTSVVIMKDCGHGPMVERPEETAKHYLEFVMGTK